MTQEQRREKLRRLGRAIVVGNRQTIVEVLDAVIEPRNALWERISDIAIGYVVGAIIEGRGDVLEGIREALDQLEGGCLSGPARLTRRSVPTSRNS